jgi:hypothetical protein
MFFCVRPTPKTQRGWGASGARKRVQLDSAGPTLPSIDYIYEQMVLGDRERGEKMPPGFIDSRELTKQCYSTFVD